MATTHSRNHTHMPDLSASLNENTSCAPLSDLWNFPQSKLFPNGNGPHAAPGAATPTATASPGPKQVQPSPPQPAAVAADHHAAGMSSSASGTPVNAGTSAAIGQPPADFMLGGSSAVGSAGGPSSFGSAVGSSLWNRPQSSASVIGDDHPHHQMSAGSSVQTAPVSAVVTPSEATTPISAPSSTSGAATPSLLQLAPGSSPTYRSQPRASGGIWGNEYPGFRHSHSVTAFSQPPAAATGRMVQSPFIVGKSGPVRALDQVPSPVSQQTISGVQAGAGVPVGLPTAASRSLDSSWDRSAFKQPNPSSSPNGAPAPVVLSVHQQQLLHQQQQQQQHRSQKKGGRPSTNTELYKTELCASYMSTGGNCPYGEKCQFAHGTQELKTVDRPPKWRSKPCQNWVKTGACSYNERCCFRHDVPVSSPQ